MPANTPSTPDHRANAIDLARRLALAGDELRRMLQDGRPVGRFTLAATRGLVDAIEHELAQAEKAADQ